MIDRKQLLIIIKTKIGSIFFTYELKRLTTKSTNLYDLIDGQYQRMDKIKVCRMCKEG